MKHSSGWVILGNQQFPVEYYSKTGVKSIYMAEDYGLCTFQKHHKQKLLLYLSSMRHYAEELRAAGFEVHYLKLSHSDKKSTYESNLLRWVKDQNIDTLHMYEIEDHFFETRMVEFTEKNGLDLKFYRTPMFISTRSEFVDYLDSAKKPFMAKFYQKVRSQHNILMTPDGLPEGGQWSFDESNRDRLPKGHEVFQSKMFSFDKISRDVADLIEDEFSEHPGSLEKQWLPLTRTQALEVLDDFLRRKMKNFGKYQDAIAPDEPFLYHSLISVGLNMGWLLPGEVVDKTLKARAELELPLNSVEGFLRQIIGWREFMRGIYHNFEPEMTEANFFNHNRKMKNCWYDGTTGLPPVDDCILKAQKYGYNHHIERLMILSNVMLLSQLNPQHVYNWFMEMYVDSSDWVMAGNVYGMGQFSEGGIFATKPYISGSNYIRKQSHYPKGDWCDIWDGLYWSFIQRNRDFLSKNPRLAMMAGTLERMNTEKKSKIFKAAEDFVEKTTT